MDGGRAICQLGLRGSGGSRPTRDVGRSRAGCRLGPLTRPLPCPPNGARRDGSPFIEPGVARATRWTGSRSDQGRRAGLGRTASRGSRGASRGSAARTSESSGPPQAINPIPWLQPPNSLWLKSSATRHTARRSGSIGWVGAAQPTIPIDFMVACAAPTHPTDSDRFLALCRVIVIIPGQSLPSGGLGPPFGDWWAEPTRREAVPWNRLSMHKPLARRLVVAPYPPRERHHA